MRAARECLMMAEHCEHLAMACIDPFNRNILLEKAQYWRRLAENTERDKWHDRTVSGTARNDPHEVD